MSYKYKFKFETNDRSEFDELMLKIAGAPKPMEEPKIGRTTAEEPIVQSIPKTENLFCATEDDAPITVAPPPETVLKTETTESGLEVHTVAPPPSVEKDSDGVHWDHRIHSSSKKTVKTTGKWARRRNTPDETYDQITAELKQAAAIPAPAVVKQASATVTIPAMPAVAPPPQPPAESQPMPYPQFITLVATQGKMDALKSACTEAGLAGLELIAGRPDLIPQLAEAIQLDA